MEENTSYHNKILYEDKKFKYRTYLYDYLKYFHNIVNPKKFFTCLNPEHIDNNPSMIFTDKYHICKCFACGVSYDIFDLIEKDFNITNFREKINKIGDLFNQIDYERKDFSEEKKYQIHDYTKFYNYCKNNINRTNYLQNRGISERLIKKYNIGFDIKRDLIIFPINKKVILAEV